MLVLESKRSNSSSVKCSSGMSAIARLLVTVLRILCCAHRARSLDSSAYRTSTSRKHAEKFSCQLMYGPRVSPTMVDAIHVGAVAERMFMRGIKHRQ